MESYKNDTAPIPTCHFSLYFEKKKNPNLSPQQMINFEKFYDCLLNFLVIKVMLYFMSIKKKKKKMEPYILIILERAGNYNGIVCFVVIFLTTSKPHQKIKIFNF